MEITPGNAQHIGSRKEQQDAFGISSLEDLGFRSHGGVLAVVADGMGGLAEGARASGLAVKTFLTAYARKTEEEKIEEALERALLETNEAVYTLARELQQEDNCGTTLVAAVVHESGLYWIYTGDSRIYLTDGKALQRLTEDQTYGRKLDIAAQLGLIEPETAAGHPEREALTSYIGAEKIEEIGRGFLPGPLPEKVSVLLCTDGLFKFLPEEKILHSYVPDPSKWVNNLVNAVIEERAPGQDNVTAVCLRLGRTEGSSGKNERPRKRLALFLVLALCVLVAGGIWEISRARTLKNSLGGVTVLPASSDTASSADRTENVGTTNGKP